MRNNMIPFTIRIEQADDVAGDFRGQLVSPSLDADLFPTGRVPLYVSGSGSSESSELRDGQFILDSFHFESLLDFLQFQPSMRRVLQEKLHADREQWRGKTSKAVVWDSVVIQSLALRSRRQLAGPMYETLTKRMSPEKAAKLIGAEGPETRSFFTVTVEARWDSEHLLRVEFRNGQLEALTHA
jgi:hypothetical protein